MRRLLAVGVSVLAIGVGLTLSERRVYTHNPITTKIMFNKEIAQIFQRRCFQCHSDNNVAFSLTTYAVARPWARAIREDVVERRMPPWGAVTGFGHFANDAGLTQREMDIIRAWADGGAPSGVLKAEESIPPVYVAAAPQWEIGAPDQVVGLGRPARVEAASGDRIKRFDVTTALGEPRALRALAFKPGDRRVVRYASVYDAASQQWLWTWTPWQTFWTLPDGVVYRLPQRARLTIEVGYRGIEELVTDASELGLYFAPARAASEATALPIAGRPVDVPPGAGAVRVRTESVIGSPRNALAVWPEPADALKSVEMSAVHADGTIEPLLWLKGFRRDWPTPYVLRTPAPLARGTRLVVTAYYDNKSNDAVTVTPKVTVVTVPTAASTTSR